MRVHGTSTSLVFSGFSNPSVRFESYKLLAIGHRAQYEIVKAVVQNHGDGPIAQPNFQWCFGYLCLLINHQIDDKMT